MNEHANVEQLPESKPVEAEANVAAANTTPEMDKQVTTVDLLRAIQSMEKRMEEMQTKQLELENRMLTNRIRNGVAATWAAAQYAGNQVVAAKDFVAKKAREGWKSFTGGVASFAASIAKRGQEMIGTVDRERKVAGAYLGALAKEMATPFRNASTVARARREVIRAAQTGRTATGQDNAPNDIEALAKMRREAISHGGDGSGGTTKVELTATQTNFIAQQMANKR